MELNIETDIREGSQLCMAVTGTSKAAEKAGNSTLVVNVDIEQLDVAQVFESHYKCIEPMNEVNLVSCIIRS